MTTNEEKLVDYLKRVAADLHDTRARLREVEDGQREPVAIVAMACRYPGGANSPEAMWDLVAEGRHAMGAFPDNRGWDLERLFHPDPDHPGTSYAREGGFLHDADLFDPEFFGISPREAAAIDPQQRLLLEVSWEVLERAGIAPASLKGTPVGVYAGTALPGFGTPHIDKAAEGYLVTGNAPSVLSGRVAYTLGLEGPAVTVDTACSASLVATHLACQALRQGECNLALAGGVTVMTIPNVFTEFARQRGLAADGRCKAFSAEADGTAFSEGVGILLLERLSDARRNGHQVLAVIRGSAVNQDGASNGLTAPNGLSQQRVIRQALAGARLSPADVDVVEAHGTGTRLGDPIEAQALLATYGQDRPAERPLWLGAVKANLGHTQGAAGVAGIIKMVMAMRHRTLPATLHADRPTPAVDWDSGAVRLLRDQVDWPAGERTRRAGVSSFGISGTNAHLILEQPPEPAEAAEASDGVAPPEGTALPWVLSARTAPALRAQAAALAEHVAAHPELPVTGIGWSLTATRSALEHRAVVVGTDRERLAARLADLAEGTGHTDITTAPVPAHSGGTAFMFTGQGSQRPGMGAGLYRAYPVFAAAFDEACDALDPLLGCSLRDLVLTPAGPETAGDLDRTEVTQAALFAVEVALYRLVESFGLVPGYLTGHSVGELVAAHVAGVLSLADAARLVAARGRLMQALPEGGAMVAVEATEEQVAPLLALLTDRVALAAVNGPSSVVVSGDEDAVEEIAGALRERGHRTKRLRVSHAFHSPRIEPMLAEFRRVAAELTFAPPRIAVISNLTGAPAGADQLCDPEYWVRHARQPVRFRDGILALRDEQVTRFLELGPDSVLTTMAEDCLAKDPAHPAGQAPVLATVLRDGRDESATLLAALARMHVDGATVDFRAAFPPDTARTELPTYRFDRRRYWRNAPDAEADVRAAGLDAGEHPLLRAVVEPADGGMLLTGRLSLRDQPWLGDHAIVDGVPLPGTAFLELAVLAGARADCDQVDDLTLEAPLLLPPTGAVQVQVAVGAADPTGRRTVTIYSRPAHEGDRDAAPAAPWVRHAAGTLAATGPVTPDAPVAPTQWPPADAVAVDVAALYERLDGEGYRYGPAFRGLHAAWRTGDEMFAEIRLAPEQHADSGQFALHPALLDAALHPIAELFTGDDQAGGAPGTVRLPFSFGGVRLLATGAARLRVRITPTGPDSVTMALADEAGTPVATIGSLTLRTVSADRWRAGRVPADNSLYQVDWQTFALPAGTPSPAGPWALVGDGEPELAADLRATGSGTCHPDLAALRAALAAGQPVPELVVLTGPGAGLPDDGEPPARVRAATHLVLSQVQEWLADDTLDATRLVVTTRGAVAATTGDAPADLAGAAVLGLLRAVQAEHPERILLADLDDDAASRQALPAAVSAAHTAGEPQLALRAGKILVPRLMRAAPGQDTTPTPLDPDGTVLVTGGTGSLGRLVARHFVEAHGIRHLLLVSRSGPAAEGIGEFAAELASDVRVESCDTTDPEALAALLVTVPEQHRLTAVVHAAGVLDDGVATSLTPGQLDAVLTPKVDAAWHLHRLTRDAGLAAFVMFSSAASVLGSAGQGNYGAANAFLNALAEHVRAAGGAATSLAWGLWASGGGMTDHLGDADLARMARSGTAAMSDEEGLALLDAALASARPTLLPARFDLATLRTQAAAGSLPAVLRRIVRVPARAVAATGAPSLSGRLAGLSAGEQDKLLTDLIREQVGTVLAHPEPATIDLGRAFHELGFDSLTALELRNRINAATGVRLPATAIFDYPTPDTLVRFVRTELLGTASAAVAAPVHKAVAVDDDPIVIVGMACHYPGGVGSPEELWRLVADGVDAIGMFPEDRGWDTAGLFDPDPDQVGRSYTREGGFLYNAALFDPEFFGISPREALATDPQQRLLLETAWQAFEDARIDPAALRGSRTAVVTGIMYDDYGGRFLGRIPEGYEGQLMTGSTPSVASGRVAYTFGLEGPAMTVDTACSSSLVAMHLAAQALRNGECDLALAGGVTVMATPNTFVEFSRQRGLAADGRCKPFAAAADGTGWGEGAGLLVLERQSDAHANGHRVLAVLRGSAINQDGASNGLTAPNGPSQQRVIRQALASAGLDPAEIDAVEAHGTGTTLGDPIEAQALLATYGKERAEDRPLWLGSVKSNIGHTQAAAGAAGVIKMIMAMRHGHLPASLHIDEPTPHVDWTDGTVRLLTESTPWPDTDRPRRAAVSSFGISGTNAHVILEQAPQPATAEPTPDHGAVVPWALSARTPDALRAQAANLAELLEGGAPLSVRDAGWSLATTRSVFEHRAVIIGQDHDTLLNGLTSLTEDRPDPTVVQGVTATTGPGPVFVFPGQGSQWLGMGVELLDTKPVFAARIAECEQALAPHVDWSLTAVLRGTDSATDPTRVDVIQPVLWAVMVSLAAVWQSYGVEPAAVIGHSQGEIAAACVAGALSLHDAATIVALRSQALRTLTGHGGMASLAISEHTTTQLLTQLGDSADGITIAAANGPTSTVISGPPDQLDAIVATLQERGERARLIDVDYASHGPQVDRIKDELAHLLHDVRPRGTDVAFYSTVTGERFDTTGLDAEYWFTNLRQPVRFATTVQTLLDDGHRVFIEASPHPVLTMGTQECFEEAAVTAVTVPTLRRDEGGPRQLALSLANAHTAGLTVGWQTWFGTDDTPRAVDLPTYPFQRERYWLDMGGEPGDMRAAGLRSAGHPMLSAAVELADGSVVMTGRLPAAGGSGWLAEHVLAGVTLVPGAALIEWVLRAADEAGCAGVEELALQAPMVLSASEALRVQVVVAPAGEEGRRDVRIHSRPDTDDGHTAWVCHATGTLAPHLTDVPPTGLAGQWPPADAEPVDVTDFYERAEATGYGYGPAFRGLTAAWRHGDDLLADLTLPETATENADKYGIHPALLDAALHPVALDTRYADGQVWLPFAWSDVSLWATGARRVRVRMTPSEHGFRLVVADLAGAPVLSAESVVVRATSAQQLRTANARAVDGLFTVEWVSLPPEKTAEAAAGTWALLGGDVLSRAAAGSEPTRYADVDALVSAVEGGAPLPSAVLVGVSDSEGDDPAAALAVTTGVLALAQRWLAEPALADVRLVVVTRDAVLPAEMEGFTGHHGPRASAASVWGLLRTAQAENPGRFLLLDTDDAEPADVLDAVARALAADEPQLALRAGRLSVPRLTRAGAPRELVPPTGERAWRLASVGTETIENVSVVPCPEVLEPLAPGQVRISVRAAGINFRDVLIALGMYPDNGVFRGSEGAGVVLEVASDVTSLAPGDRVMGLFEGAFGPIAVTDVRNVVPLPPGWDDEQGAAIPVTFLTAWFGLVDLADLQAGETVLIHAATGGVGMAAVTIARHLGAHVYATASPAKHSVLEAMGIDQAHRASSRDLDFEDTFRTATDGKGFDVVLDCLAGDFVDASLRLLHSGGRFIEMGKTDIRDPEKIALDHPGVRYRSYDLVSAAGLDRIADMLATLSELFAKGVLQPPPIHTWPLAKTRQALRHMSQAHHTGKLVLEIPPALNPDGTVLITGGTGTLGTLTAEHLITTHNIRHLLLLSRSGPDAPGAHELRARLTELGATVTITAVDTADPDALTKVIADIDPAHPLTGVIHAAGALDDAVLTAQTPGHLDRVWAAKATAAANLHHATAGIPLAMFVIYSSAAGTLGSPGQANYAAANAYCDALTAQRRAAGLAGVSIAWGLWATSSGMTGHLADTDHARMSRSGFTPLSSTLALTLLDAAQQHGSASPLAIDLDPRALGGRQSGPVPALLRALAETGAPVRRAAAGQRQPADWTSQLSGLSASERERALLDLVRTHASTVLGHSDPLAVRADASFKELGFDSLTAVELRNRLSAATGLRLPAALVFDYPEATALADHLSRQLFPAEGPVAADDGLAPVLGDLARLESTLSGHVMGGESRATVVGRLNALLSKLEELPAGATGIDGEALESASDDEMFALIDQQLRSS